MDVPLIVGSVIGYLVTGLLLFPLSNRFPKQLGPARELMDGVMLIASSGGWVLGPPLCIIFWSLWPVAMIFAPFLPKLALKGVLESPATEGALFVGKEAVCSTDLRPCGEIKVDGKIHSAMSVKGFVAKGDPVRVLRKQGFSLIVEKVSEELP